MGSGVQAMINLADKLASELGREPTSYELAQAYELEEDFDVTTYVPPGPVMQGFVNDRTKVVFGMGPVGGGKTTAAVMKRIYAGTLQPVMPDGWRRDHWVVVRDTFRNAEKSVLESWQRWFPKKYLGGDWTGGNDRPAVHTLRFELPDGSKCEMKTTFLGLNGEKVEDKMRGWELSGAWMNEADTMDEDVLTALEQRVGRYPRKSELRPGDEPFAQIIGDFNAPDQDNWVYRCFVEHPTPDRKLHAQPSGLSDMAENVQRLPKDYYQKIIANEEDWYVQRFVHNRFGFSRYGLPVYINEFRPHVHLAAARLVVDPTQPLIVAADPGTSNAALVFLQPTAKGQLRAVLEIVPGQGYGAVACGMLLKAALENEFRGIDRSRVFGFIDPAGGYGGGIAILNWMEEISMASGVMFSIPGDGNNDPMRRVDAVRKDLLTMIDADTPALLVCQRGCPMLARGFASGYRFKKNNNATGAQHKYQLIPEKNQYSHPHDALQYGVIGWRSLSAVRGTGGWRASTGKPQGRRSNGFNPHKIGV